MNMQLRANIFFDERSKRIRGCKTRIFPSSLKKIFGLPLKMTTLKYSPVRGFSQNHFQQYHQANIHLVGLCNRPRNIHSADSPGYVLHSHDCKYYLYISCFCIFKFLICFAGSSMR